MKMRKRSGALVNLLLILLIAALYFATSRPDAAAAVAQLYYAPAYRGRAEDAIALQFACLLYTSAFFDGLHRKNAWRFL